MKKSIFKEGKKYTFRDYFDLPNPTEEIINELGYSYSLGIIELPKSENCDIHSIQNLKDNYYKVLPKINLDSEAAKREFLIAPILFEVAKSTDSKISVEYQIEIDDKLSGYMDYLIRSKQEIVIIEAKKGDIDKGFNQLAAELIALDKYEDENNNLLYGAITIGEMWRFSILNRKTKHITKDIHSFTVPEDVEIIFRILVGITEFTI
ncbi:MAG: hypothetical protein HQK78_19195 [Desulfobacterales bacterium]|nr:hypothetical protein [Desulfobacterales bacterium]